MANMHMHRESCTHIHTRESVANLRENHSNILFEINFNVDSFRIGLEIKL